MDSFIIAIIGLALLAVVVVAVSLRRSDTSTAVGQLSNETVRRDRSNDQITADTASEKVVTGKAVEAAARGGAPGALVAQQDSAPPVVYVPPDPETLGVTRRQFLNRSIIVTFAMGLSGFGAACLAFLWPPPGGGFGSKVNVGRVADIEAAVRAGGARNHRGNLSDWIMLKDNHLMGLSIADGVAEAKRRWPARTVHVEADRLEQVEAAVEAKADAILLDNMEPATLTEAVELVINLTNGGPRPLLEASGGIDLTTIEAVSHTGVDMISTSKLCFGAPTLDIGLDIHAENSP